MTGFKVPTMMPAIKIVMDTAAEWIQPQSFFFQCRWVEHQFVGPFGEFFGL